MSCITTTKHKAKRAFKFIKKHHTPRNQLIVRSFIVGVLSIVNIVMMIKDIKHNPDASIACGVTTICLLSCLSVLIKVGYKTLPEQMREFEGIPEEPITESEDSDDDDNSTTSPATTGAATKKAVSNHVNGDADYLSIADRGDVSDNSIAGDLTSKKSLSTDIGSDEGCKSPTIVGKYIISDDPQHPANRCFFRRHPNILIPLGLLGFFGAVSTAIYYLVLGIRDGKVPTMTTLQDTFYMCFILYMVCGKWCVMIVLLMRKLKVEQARYFNGSLFTKEAEEKDAARAKRQAKREAKAAKKAAAAVANENETRFIGSAA